MSNIEYNARQKFQDRVTKGMLGPGSDTWGVADKEEIISDYPLIRYFTGVLFPEKASINSQLEDDIAEVENQTDESEELQESKVVKEQIEDIIDSVKPDIKEHEEDLKINQNSFFPTNIGLTICVDNAVNEIDAEFSFGIYYQPTYKEKKIKISETGYRSLIDESIPYKLSFKDKLKYDGEFMYIEKDLDGFAGGSNKTRSGDYRAFDDFKNRKNLADSSAKYFIEYLEKLISRAWKRKNIVIRKNIIVENSPEPVALNLSESTHKELKISYNIKTYLYQGRKYVKVQLVNTSKVHPRNKYSNKNEKLNSKCLFQSKISLITKNILPYKTQNENIALDEEAEKLNFIYRKNKAFGIGHNCAINWDSENPSSVETTFTPYTDIKDIRNDFDLTNNIKLNEALNIKNLSVFGHSKTISISNLKYFISLYNEWILKQDYELGNINGKDQSIAKKILSKQYDNLKRLNESLTLLENDDVFIAFQLANTAMYIQLITSNDNDFGKYEKGLDELNGNIDYKNLEFFRTYDAIQRKKDGKIKFIPKYRPFQLAFLLLSIDGISNPKSKSRKDIVDLIWFPTGGGKTEAYLAVTAFTIIWRRMKNPIGYQGTTVLMRYTLRLLTAQQFERASRLILALEFLRQQSEYSTILRDEPVSIGLWVGMASTPNKLEVAKSKVDDIEKECDRKNGNPHEKNIFQISSCPWCGTKLISKNKDKWDYGFETSKTDFKIYCLNPNCAFHKRIPIQVVDEVLYKQPPTLLFGTVDKFAMLAWQEEAFMFFNTHNPKNLPPDLIIQDELHLLSGPLGSITGIFESVIELLSTKNGIAPKIIASTATTRNTDCQIDKLYGNREVNIFPPSGLYQDDSFFAKEDSDNSKRRYMGIMPTGKTTIDTQLQIMAHLLVSRLEVYVDNITKGTINNYWTLVSYYNSLRDVGRINNKVGDEITTFTAYLQNRLSSLFPYNVNDYKFNFSGINTRTKELTSRIPSEKIKETLVEIEREFNESRFTNDEYGRKYLNDIVDLVLATNMISVGIDIGRLNIMLINGMPKNIAEYIQASSRIGRNTKGLVITLYDPNRSREKSYFENFKNFHQSFYKTIEPLSITPFTENTIRKMISSLLISFIRQYYPGELNKNNQAQYFTKDRIDPLLEFIKLRFRNQPLEISLFEKELNRLSDEWVERINQTQLKKYDELLIKPSEREGNNEDWVIMQSMREVDTNTYIQIKGYI
jgi:hypothetical protein